MSALHPNSLSLIETQSELIDRQRTVVCRGCSIYKHRLHLGRIPCPLACSYITRQQTIPCLQPSVLTDNGSPASFFFFFFFLTDLISATLSKIPIHLVLRVWVDAIDVLRKPRHGFIAPTISWNNITTVWANAISNLPSHVSPTKITRVTSQRALQSDCCSRTADATVQHRSCSNT